VERHVALLGILARLWGALAVLVGVSMLLLAAGAFALSAEPEGETVTLAASLTAVVFVSIGIFSLVWGVAHMWAAALLRRRAPSGRLLTLGLGVVNLLVFPFGTALGGYALWILLTHEGRRLFETVGRPQADGAIR
jgi:hypothetical protein